MMERTIHIPLDGLDVLKDPTALEDCKRSYEGNWRPRRISFVRRKAQTATTKTKCDIGAFVLKHKDELRVRGDRIIVPSKRDGYGENDLLILPPMSFLNSPYTNANHVEARQKIGMIKRVGREPPEHYGEAAAAPLAATAAAEAPAGAGASASWARRLSCDPPFPCEAPDCEKFHNNAHGFDAEGQGLGGRIRLCSRQPINISQIGGGRNASSVVSNMNTCVEIKVEERGRNILRRVTPSVANRLLDGGARRDSHRSIDPGRLARHLGRNDLVNIPGSSTMSRPWLISTQMNTRSRWSRAPFAPKRIAGYATLTIIARTVHIRQPAPMYCAARQGHFCRGQLTECTDVEGRHQWNCRMGSRTSWPSRRSVERSCSITAGTGGGCGTSCSSPIFPATDAMTWYGRASARPSNRTMKNRFRGTAPAAADTATSISWRKTTTVRAYLRSRRRRHLARRTKIGARSSSSIAYDEAQELSKGWRASVMNRRQPARASFGCSSSSSAPNASNSCTRTPVIYSASMACLYLDTFTRMRHRPAPRY